MCLHWRKQPGARITTAEPLADALVQSFDCQDLALAIATIDSALNRGLVAKRALASALSDYPDLLREALGKVDHRSESGTETLVRLRLRQRGIRLRTPVQCGLGRVDILVGDRLVIECDSRAHHTGEEGYATDRERDLVLIDRGYVVVRLTYAHVLFEWDRVEQIILDLVRRREHYWPRQRT